MHRAIKFTSVFVLVLCYLLNLSAPSKACSTVSEESADPKLLVARAEVIVRAVAVKYAEQQAEVTSAESLRGPREIIEFKVEEVLKGEAVPTILHINGWLSDKDDFNDSSMPLYSIRPDGRGGSCHAYSYKQGGEFLLFVKKRGDCLTPYWASMAASNQQLHSSDDLWLGWVKQHLSGPDASNNRMHPTGISIDVIRKVESLGRCLPAGDAGRYTLSLSAN
jgi:hypothetical protein